MTLGYFLYSMFVGALGGFVGAWLVTKFFEWKDRR